MNCDVDDPVKYRVVTVLSQMVKLLTRVFDGRKRKEIIIMDAFNTFIRYL